MLFVIIIKVYYWCFVSNGLDVGVGVLILLNGLSVINYFMMNLEGGIIRVGVEIIIRVISDGEMVSSVDINISIGIVEVIISVLYYVLEGKNVMVVGDEGGNVLGVGVVGGEVVGDVMVKVMGV